MDFSTENNRKENRILHQKWCFHRELAKGGGEVRVHVGIGKSENTRDLKQSEPFNRHISFES